MKKKSKLILLVVVEWHHGKNSLLSLFCLIDGYFYFLVAFLCNFKLSLSPFYRILMMMEVTTMGKLLNYDH